MTTRLHTLLLCLALALLLPGCEKIEGPIFHAMNDYENSRAGLTAATVQVDDITWSYLKNEWKDGQETVVLLHGFTADKSNWVRFAGAFGPGYNIVIPDLPGHGETTHDIKLAYDIDTQARRVLSMMDTLGVHKFHIAGNSMGGAIAARAAWLAPANILSLGLFDAAGAHMQDSEFDAQLAEGNNPLIVKNPGDMATVMAWATAQPPFLPWPVLSVLERTAIERAELHEKIFKDLRRDNSIDQTAILPEVIARTLVLWGDQDRLLHVANADLFVTTMPNAKKVIMPGIGHVPMVEAPEESAKIYRDFLAGY